MAKQLSLLELSPPPTPTNSKYIPMEILFLILEFVDPCRQDVFASASLVSRQWYFVSQRFLYRNPKIYGNNYLKFVATISPSSTNIKPSPLASFVKRLDLSSLVHHARPSLNARLLRRVQVSLEEFIAPQASFGYACIVALGHCQKLRLLDLSLVSQSANLEDLFRHIQNLPNLTILNFPRSSMYSQPPKSFTWPKRLERFAISGAVLDYFLHEKALPATLQELHISHCPFTKKSSILCLVSSLSAQLTTLSITYPMPRLPFNALDNVLNLCPNLECLLLAVDYISNHFFDAVASPPDHPLRRLDLDSSGYMGVEHKISPDDIFIALAEDRLSSLRIVRVSSRLKWLEREKEDVDDLIEILEEKAQRSGDPLGCGSEVGVWEFDSHGDKPVQRSR